MTTQIAVMLEMLRKGWQSTSDFNSVGVNFPHSRLSEWKKIAQNGFAGSTNYYQVGRHQYTLEERARTVKTRWGPTRILEHRLKMVRH